MLINYTLGQDAAKYIRDSFDLVNIRKMQIALDTNEQFTGTSIFPFKSIRIADVRFDTTQIGNYVAFNNILLPSIKNYKINFKEGINSLSNYLNNFFKTKTGDENLELVCFLKKLNVIKRDTFTENVSLLRTYGQINFQTEVFLRSGNRFYAVFKIDTVLVENINTQKKDIIDELREYLLMPALKIMKDKVSNTDWDKIIKKKSFKDSIVYENYYTNRFNLSVLNQLYKKGIFKTFAEFKNNSPSIIDFKVKKGKGGSVSLTDKNEDYITTIKMFGFSDGKRCWILNGNYCYPLIRTGNSFEFFLTLIYNLKILITIDMEKDVL